MSALQRARVLVADPPLKVTGEWLSGFADGEAHFGIAGHGGALQPRFRLNQRDDDADLLRAIRTFLGVGSLRPRTRDKNPNANPQAVLAVVGADCRVLVDIFDVHPLLSKKRFEYVSWREAVNVYSASLGSRWQPGIVVERTRKLTALKHQLAAWKVYGGPR